MNNQTNKGTIGVIVVLIVLIVIAGTLYYQNREISGEDAASEQQPMGKVAAANIVDGEYYARVEIISTSPEDTTITFRPVSYFEGDAAVQTAAIEGKSAEVRNGVYVRESGSPSFTAPLTADATLTASQIRALMTDPSYMPVFLVDIENGNIKAISEVTKK